MARFQERIYHADTVAKRPLTAGDAMFLAELQRELNTQPTMGNAAPRFWVLAQEEETAAPKDGYGADAVAVDTEDGGTVAGSLEELAKWLDDGNADEVAACPYFNKSCTVKFADGDSAGCYSMEDVAEALEDHGSARIEIRYVWRRTRPVQDTLFLTHKDAEDHLRDYGYNYGEDAHAFAMTAVRSPRFEALMELLQSVDWSALQVSGS